MRKKLSSFFGITIRDPDERKTKQSEDSEIDDRENDDIELVRRKERQRRAPSKRKKEKEKQIDKFRAGQNMS